MSHCILNLLPIQGGEASAFEAIAPEATHLYAKRSTVTAAQLAQATIVLGGPTPKDLSNVPNLQWFHTQWAGMDEYLGTVPFPKGCRISNSTGTNAQSVSEHMLAALLSLCRCIPQIRDYQNQQKWVNIGDCRTISGATVLVVGAGNIGRRFGKLCQSMGAHTLGLQRTPSAALEGFHSVHTMDELDALLPTADVVALCLPATPQTDNLMSAHRFSLMQEGSIFLNAGRGNSVDQTALLESLTSGHLWAASIDVTTPEPLPADHPLWRAPNLLLTPHCAGGMRLEVTRQNAIALAQENLRRYLSGAPLINEVHL